jgi:alanine racemase
MTLNDSEYKHPTVAVIDLQALTENLSQIQKWVGYDKKVIPIVKADAYGHGAVEVSREIIKSGYNLLGVGFIEEAIRLRTAGIQSEIIVFCGITNGQEQELVRESFEPVVYTKEIISILSKECLKQNKKVSIHLKLDSGMGRLGFSFNEIEEAISLALNSPGIVLKGILTHFAEAYSENNEFTRHQISLMNRLIQNLKQKNIPVPMIHAANSGGIYFFREAHFDAVRPGILLYGAKPAKKIPDAFNLKQVMTLKSKIIQLKKIDKNSSISYSRTFITKRDSIIATVPIGYADGYMRSLSNRVSALIDGKRVRQVGIICMDMSMFDVTDIPDIKTGTEVILIGQEGDDIISVDNIADLAGTIPYEIFCHIGNRVKRKYINQKN